MKRVGWPRMMLAAAVVVSAGLACGEGTTAPVPGTLVVSLATPNADDGAILFTVLGILFESRLPDLSAAPYDRRITEGYLGVLVTKTNGRASAAEQALRQAGAVDVVAREPEGRRQ